jgi:hypothetical protein
MSKVRLTGIAAALVCISALFQVFAWIGGAPAGQAFYACLAACYAVLWWQKDKEMDERLRGAGPGA